MPEQCRGLTPLHIASSHGQVEAAWLLLDSEADVNAKGDGGWTPLHVATCNGHLKVGKLLLKRNATWDIRNKDGKTPFELTFDSRHANGVHALQQEARGRSQRS